MRIIVDTNIVFSAILNTNSRIATILIQPKSRLNFYSTEQLLTEIEEHKDKLKSISKYSDLELSRVIAIIISRIRFINVKLIPREIYLMAEALTKDVDIDDTEFIALTEHAKAKLWSGDKELITGLRKKKWNKVVTTDELYNLVVVKK